MVELHGADVVEVTHQREDAPALLVVPDLDLRGRDGGVGCGCQV